MVVNHGQGKELTSETDINRNAFNGGGMRDAPFGLREKRNYEDTENTEFIKQYRRYQREDVDRINSDRITKDPKITSTSKK
jgi:hypothetical protein